jgi:hypothetical protein
MTLCPTHLLILLFHPHGKHRRRFIVRLGRSELRIQLVYNQRYAPRTIIHDHPIQLPLAVPRRTRRGLDTQPPLEIQQSLQRQRADLAASFVKPLTFMCRF